MDKVEVLVPKYQSTAPRGDLDVGSLFPGEQIALTEGDQPDTVGQNHHTGGTIIHGQCALDMWSVFVYSGSASGR